MPENLKRITGFGDLHFITFCCYQRRSFFGSGRARNLAVRSLERTRARYGFALVGYVFMPEHVHLLLSESGSVSPAKIIQIFKQRVSRSLRARKRKRPVSWLFAFPSEAANSAASGSAVITISTSTPARR